jgi:hypothetical protein
MPSPPRKHRLSSERRRALQLLASSRHGGSEELLVLGHGFSRQLLAGLVRRGLAAAEREVAMAGGTAIEVRPYDSTTFRLLGLYSPVQITIWWRS